MTKAGFYTVKEELANTISHSLGILLGVFAGYLLIGAALNNESSWALWSVIIYLFGMIASYVTSTIYHASVHPLRKKLFRKFDHAAIYFHIAGTYTPFTLLVLREQSAWGWSLFSFIWLAAVIGLIFSFKKLKKHSSIETVCFVIMGCSILVAIKPLSDVLSVSGQIKALYWLIAGGVSYIVGALFYSLTKISYMHTVFHLFVLGGSVCHIIAIYLIL